ncbi:MAG: DnaD domain-containing protein [Tumebacillaceae bacterium]
MAETQSHDNALTVLMTSGFTTIPGILLQKYKQLGLKDEEMMLLLHLIQHQQEGVKFPTFEQLGERMSTREEIPYMLQKLIMNDFLTIAEEKGLGQETYDLLPLYRKLSKLLEKPKVPPLTSLDLLEKKDQTNVFALFEQEFGRPLSPLEYEKIVRWIDEDQYKEEIIREALREAVLSAKFNFKYIDRILFEWQKNHIRTLQELNTYREQFRNRMPGARSGGKAPTGGGYNNKNVPKDKPLETEAEQQGNKYDAFYKMYGRE